MQYPDDETYPVVNVNYVRLHRLPKFDEGWSSVLKAMRAGDFFVTTGEILFRGYGVASAGAARTFRADLEWTFPLEFLELVWGDGGKTGRFIVRATELPPLGSHQFQIPFDPAGKKW